MGRDNGGDMDMEDGSGQRKGTEFEGMTMFWIGGWMDRLISKPRDKSERRGSSLGYQLMRILGLELGS